MFRLPFLLFHYIWILWITSSQQNVFSYLRFVFTWKTLYRFFECRFPYEKGRKFTFIRIVCYLHFFFFTVSISTSNDIHSKSHLANCILRVYIWIYINMDINSSSTCIHCHLIGSPFLHKKNVDLIHPFHFIRSANEIAVNSIYRKKFIWNVREWYGIA